TTSSPESAHLAGLRLNRRFGVPWVADFRDPWVGRATYRPPTPLHDRIQRGLERAVVERADRVTMVSEAMIDEYRRRYPHVPGDRFCFLPNGYDPDDFRRAGDHPPGGAAAGRPRFLLLHAGQLAQRPTVRTVLDAVRRLRAEEPALAERLRIRFLGGNEELNPADVSRPDLGDSLELSPSVPHLRALAEMCAADGLLLLGHSGRGDALIYTGKIYEYLASGRPLLAVLDPGPAAELIDRLKAGVLIRPGDSARLASVLRDWVSGFVRGGRGETRPLGEALHGLERREIAVRAAALLSQISA
ncbi:MAG TPA: glycosyltransferase, partial [Candidatus Eisenbacteria bacterium]